MQYTFAPFGVNVITQWQIVPLKSPYFCSWLLAERLWQTTPQNAQKRCSQRVIFVCMVMQVHRKVYLETRQFYVRSENNRTSTQIEKCGKPLYRDHFSVATTINSSGQIYYLTNRS